MWNFTRRLLHTGIRTDTTMPSAELTQIEEVGERLSQTIAKRFQRALAIRVVDAGSCNGCEQEINALHNPFYAFERFGLQFVASPRHADILLVTGPVTRAMESALHATYDAMPAPKKVIAIGDCGACGGVFAGSPAIVGAVSQVLPVDVIVHGCPPTPWAILNGILTCIQR